MELLENEGLYIKEQELLLLLAGTGIEQWYGIATNKKKDTSCDFSKEDIYQILLHLYQKEYVEWNHGEVEIQYPLCMIIKELKKVKGGITVEKEGRETKIYYFGPDQVICMEKSQNEISMLRISSQCRTRFQENLWEELKILQTIPVDFCYEKEEIEKQSDLKVTLTLWSLNQEQEDKLEIRETKGVTILTRKKESEERKMPFCLENYEKQLEEWMGNL